jgi:hypothetical protein
MKIINRAEITDKYLREILDVERHHDHVVLQDEDGIYMWQQNMNLRQLTDELGLNKVMQLFELLGCNRNSEIVRKLYRDLGYSLGRYWEVFYWEANNDVAKEYCPPNPKQAWKSPWICFPDHKPEPYVWVLVTGQNSCYAWVELAQFDGEFFELPAKVQTEVVTHWMPLPPHAKKQRDDE